MLNVIPAAHPHNRTHPLLAARGIWLKPRHLCSNPGPLCRDEGVHAGRQSRRASQRKKGRSGPSGHAASFRAARSAERRACAAAVWRLSEPAGEQGHLGSGAGSALPHPAVGAAAVSVRKSEVRVLAHCVCQVLRSAPTSVGVPWDAQVPERPRLGLRQHCPDNARARPASLRSSEVQTGDAGPKDWAGAGAGRAERPLPLASPAGAGSRRSHGGRRARGR